MFYHKPNAQTASSCNRTSPPSGRGRESLKAFVATLGYSRATYVQFFDREDSDAWLTGLREAFVYFGGVRPRPSSITEPRSSASAMPMVKAFIAGIQGSLRWPMSTVSDPESAVPIEPRPRASRTLQRLSERQLPHAFGRYAQECRLEARMALRQVRILATDWRAWLISVFTAPPATNQQSDWLKSSMSCFLCPSRPSLRARRLRCVPVGSAT